MSNIDWRKDWLLPHKYFLPNKTKEIHFKILHKVCPVYSFMSKYVDIPSNCTFCGKDNETLIHLFCMCEFVQQFWFDLNHYLNNIF